MSDIRTSDAWKRAKEHFTRLHAPQFGSPHRLDEPSVSADGASVMVTGHVLDAMDGVPRQQVYAVENDTLRPLLAPDASSHQAKVSPDGTRVLVLSDRAQPGCFQLLILGERALSEVHAAPPVPGTVEYAAWSPDGARVLLGVAELGADVAGGLGSGTTSTSVDQLPDWHPDVHDGLTHSGWRSLWQYDLGTGRVRRWSPAGLNVWEAAWCGTSDSLIVHSPDPTEDSWYGATLSRLSADGQLTALHQSKDQIGWPSASPAGSAYAFVEALCSDRCLVAGDLQIAAGGDSPRRADTHGIDVTSTQWLDEARLGITGLRGLETVAAVYDIVTRTCAEVWSSRETTCGPLAPYAAWTSAGVAVVVEEGYAVPPRVLMVGDEGGAVVAAVANEGTEYARAVSGDLQCVQWSAPDGTPIDGLLVTPASPGPHPLIVSIHGGPVWAARSSWPQSHSVIPWLVAEGYAVLSPNIRGSSGRGEDFARSIVGDMGGADTSDVTAGVDALVAQGLVDPARVGLTGGSYGGFLTCWLATQDQRWAAAVAVAPVTDWYSQHYTSNISHFDRHFLGADPTEPAGLFHQRSPVLHAHRVRTPFLLVAGGLDRCTPPTQAQEFHQALAEHGVLSRLAVYPQEGHGVRSFPAVIDFTARVLEWFTRHMPSQETS
jgi:dipeptidyl aminopeptidase/acylaminoacyl peptidase